MIRNISKIVVGVLLISFILPVLANGQDESFRIKLESILFRFKNYRFSNVALYELKDAKDVRKAIQTKERKKKAAETGAEASEECVKTADPAIASMIESGVQRGESSARIQRQIIGRGLALPEQFECIFNYYESQQMGPEEILRKAYVVTTRVSKGEAVPNTLIAMIVSYEDEDRLVRSIDRPNPKNVYTYNEMKQFELDSKEFGSENMYDLVMTSFYQNNVTNRTLEAQGIGTLIQWTPVVHGVSRNLIKQEADIKGKDIQAFKRISDGMPFDYFQKKNEVVASPDLISWKRFDIDKIVYDDGFVDTLSDYTNTQLPKYGVELKYGIPSINYPSFWSERMTVSALWQNVKLGVILPTSGWAELSNSMFSQERRLTHGGSGISGEADFPVMVIPESGIFHVEGAFLFGDAEPAPYKDRNVSYANFPLKLQQGVDLTDYMIRANGQVHYTFAISVDENYLMRFGIGATAYQAETWTYRQDTDNEELEYYKLDAETVGGLSGKIEAMVTDVATPYGGSIQYFDESLYTSIWLHFPVIENTLGVRLEANGFFTAFRDDLHPWENDSVFIPMARFVFTF